MEDEEAAAALAVRYGLLTTHTHLVMIAERAEKLDGLPVLRRASGMVAAGWMGHGRVTYEASYAMDVGVLPSLACSDMSFESAPPASLRRGRSLGKLPRFASSASADATGRSGPFDVIAKLRQALDGADLDDVDLVWLARAGAPSDLCDRLRMLLSPEINERVLALAILYMLVSEAGDDRLPKARARRIRRAWTELGGLSPERRSDLLEAVRAIAHDRRLVGQRLGRLKGCFTKRAALRARRLARSFLAGAGPSARRSALGRG